MGEGAAAVSASGARSGAHDPGQLAERPAPRPRVPGALPARASSAPLRPVQHRPAAHPLGELPQHRRDRVRAGRGRREALLGLRDAAQFRVAGLGHELPDRAGHAREGGPGRDLEEREAVGVAGRDQRARDRVVHRGHAEAEGRAARRDDPGDVVVEVGARARRLRDVDPGGEQQLAAEQIRVRVRHLRGVRPVDHRVRVGGAGDLVQAEILPGQQRGERHGRGRRYGREGGTRLGRMRPAWWTFPPSGSAAVDETYTSVSLSGHLVS